MISKQSLNFDPLTQSESDRQRIDAYRVEQQAAKDSERDRKAAWHAEVTAGKQRLSAVRAENAIARRDARLEKLRHTVAKARAEVAAATARLDAAQTALDVAELT